MAFEYYSAMARLETEIASELSKSFSHRAMSSDIASKLIDIINESIGKGRVDRKLIASIRLAIKLHPYSPDVPALFAIYNKLVVIVMGQRMPALVERMALCQKNSVPLPLIVSCEKYLSGALTFQADLQRHYFSIPPVIVKGDTTITEEHFENNILTVPVDDSYEGLPLKLLETYAIVSALNEKCGILKIDDDCTVKPNFNLDQKKVSSLFTAADYMGIAVQSIFHDRLCHQGKCRKPVPYSYGKPMKTPWARGALYYLSHHALQALTLYYYRFPGVLEGEMYEDKAVADILYENNIVLAPYPLELLLGLDTTSPER